MNPHAKLVNSSLHEERREGGGLRLCEDDPGDRQGLAHLDRSGPRPLEYRDRGSYSVNPAGRRPHSSRSSLAPARHLHRTSPWAGCGSVGLAPRIAATEHVGQADTLLRRAAGRSNGSRLTSVVSGIRLSLTLRHNVPPSHPQTVTNKLARRSGLWDRRIGRRHIRALGQTRFGAAHTNEPYPLCGRQREGPYI